MDVRTDRQTAAPVECLEQATWEAAMGSQTGSGMLQCSEYEGIWGRWDLPKTPGGAMKLDGGADGEY